ncbi:fungal-specific transcription factor domain-containing protein [Bisporella sp. PMI_857]|nr:fungal-specific transcription factor domain-containing protein [Bisporella sp. PMI_857]
MQLQKRRKTQLACSQCRSRKTRCNGSQPTCKSCEERGLQCLYETSSLKPNSSLSDIESRLRRLEQSRPCPALPEIRSSIEQPSSRLTDFQEHRQGISSVLINEQVQGDEVPNYHSNEVNKSFYGASSNDSFIQQVDKAVKSADSTEVQPMNEIRNGQHNPIRSSATFQALELPIVHGASVAILPERQVADILIDCFWVHIYPIFPIIHRPSFWHSYQQLWKPAQAQQTDSSINGVCRAVFHSTLNIIFALGCQYYDKISSEQRISLADQFYQRSRTFVSTDALDTPSVAVVQMLLLTGIYLHSTKYANRCWNIIGVALRVAQGLGLHQESSNTSHECQITREMRRRVWYSCVMLDKLTASTFGRPVLLSKKSKVKVPEPIDDEFLRETGEGFQQPDHPARIECFVYSINLFDILDEVLSTFYSHSGDDTGHSPRSNPDTAQSFRETFALNSRLDEFLKNLPLHLRLDNHSANYEGDLKRCFQLQAKTLYCRSLYIRILLLRPWLIAGIQTESDQMRQQHSPYTSGLEQSAVNEMRRLCVSTAQSTIETLYDHHQSPSKTSSWHAVFFSFTAATVLWTAALCPQTGVDLESESYRCSWERAIKILDYNRIQLQASPHAVEVLEACRSRLLARKKRGLQIGDGAFRESNEFEFDAALESSSDWISSIESSFFDLTGLGSFQGGWPTHATDVEDWH